MVSICLLLFVICLTIHLNAFQGQIENTFLHLNNLSKNSFLFCFVLKVVK